eukprot:TRINITY_DN36011_c0_g1_i1.p2 TRINITY_DN36011_c0_g1~~TRINITY_DN36011_c0_g1_i1.p2  ORF type:complete len:237 (+),score=79.14 TRINITY_DN36011_c0_g1_i1:44-712(+)
MLRSRLPALLRPRLVRPLRALPPQRMFAAESATPPFVWRRPGRPDVAVADPGEAAQSALASFRTRAVARELADAEDVVAKLEQRIAPLEIEKARIDTQAERYPSRFIHAAFFGLVFLWCLMFWMVFAGMIFGPQTFFAFDWNTVEPITYFVLYSGVWIAVVFYYFSGEPFSYSSLCRLLAASRRRRLYMRSRRFDPGHYDALKRSLDSARREVHSLRGVRGL